MGLATNKFSFSSKFKETSISVTFSVSKYFFRMIVFTLNVATGQQEEDLADEEEGESE